MALVLRLLNGHHLGALPLVAYEHGVFSLVIALALCHWSPMSVNCLVTLFLCLLFRFLHNSARKLILEDGYKIDGCISYLSNEKIISKDAWLDRMRNLAMSCAMVCLILLATSAPLGILGLIKKQISTIMVTGVMYILAGVFGIFNLAFMHFKRVKPDGFYTSTILDLNLPEEYMKSRKYSVGWPPSSEWAGLCLCLVGSLFWLILAKIYRFQILSAP